MNNWRATSQKIIYKIIKDNPGLSKSEYEKLIFSAYPFGERKHWPYKEWLKVKNELLHIHFHIEKIVIEQDKLF